MSKEQSGNRPLGIINSIRAAVGAFPQPDPARVLGMDTSFWSGAVNFDVARVAGIQFVIGKASGGTLVDSMYIANYNAAKAAGLVVGAYHWLYAGRNISIDAQVATFARLLRDYPVDIDPVVDFETTRYGGVVSNPTSADLLYFCNHLYQETGRRAMIYTAPAFWAANGSQSSDWLNYQLWEANYSTRPAPIAPWGTSNKFWQWTPNGDGLKYGQPAGSLSADLNYYNGSQQKFDAEFGLTPPPVDPPPGGAWLELLSVTGEDGTKIPTKCVVHLSSADWGPLTLSIDQTPVVTPPPAVADLYRVAAELWPINHGGQEQPGDGGPLTQVASESTKGGKYTNPLDTLWQNYIKSFNTPKAWDKIKAPDFGPSQGLNDKGKLKWNYLVWPGANVVRVLEISGGWAKIETITTRNGGQTPDTHPWLFHRVCDNRGNPVLVQGAPIICPLIGAAVWVPMSALVKL